jgi:hypothetical protein
MTLVLPSDLSVEDYAERAFATFTRPSGGRPYIGGAEAGTILLEAAALAQIAAAYRDSGLRSLSDAGKLAAFAREARDSRN